MNSACTLFRADALDADAARVRTAAHRAECAACAQWFDRLQGRERALSSLERLKAPFELEGGVVQALEAGFRQDRAVRALSSLERVDSPPELDFALDSRLERAPAQSDWTSDSGDLESLPASLPRARRLGAPARLAELVAEELGDPAGHRARRYVGSLKRLSAPAELAERLARDGWQAPERRRGLPLALAGLGLALAAILVTAVLRGTDSPRPARYDFVVEVVDSPAQMAGFGAGMLDGLSGGLLSAGSL